MIELFSYSLSTFELIILLISAIFIGMGKTGVPGAGMISIPLIVIVFSSKASTGIILPLLIFGDLFAVYNYSKYTNWKHLKQLLPLTLIGVVIASVIGTQINDLMFRNIMGITIFFIIGLMVWQERKPVTKTPGSLWFITLMGIACGFTTMIGNLAGPLIGLYLLSMRFPKKEFIGTGAWYFLIVNLFKIPFHIFAWETITLNSFLLDIALLPGIALGAWVGVKVMKRIKEKTFRYLVIGITFLAAITIFI